MPHTSNALASSIRLQFASLTSYTYVPSITAVCAKVSLAQHNSARRVPTVLFAPILHGNDSRQYRT